MKHQHPSSATPGGEAVSADNQAITSRKEDEIEHATLVALVEHSPDAVVGETLNGIITSWNPGAERIFGYRAAEAVGRHISMLAPPDNPNDVLEIIRRVRCGEVVQRVAAERIRKDGRRITVSLAVCPICTPDGRVMGITKIAHDITERRQAMQALQKSEENLRILFNSVLDGIVLHTPEGVIVDANESWCRLHGVNLEQARRVSIADVSAPSMRMETTPALWAKVLAGEPQAFEWRSRRAGDGAEFDAEIFLRHLHVNGQDLILANVRDITERKRTEQALRDNERRWRAMFEHAGVGIVEVTGTDHFIAANKRACEIVGRPLEELLRTNVHELTWPEDRELSDRLNASVHTGGRERVAYEKRYTRGDGSPVWVHVTVSAVRDDQGQWTGSITTIEDITERKRAEAAARAAREELAQANAHLERKVQERTAQLLEANANLQTFAYTAAHDLRSPLRSIRAFSQMAAEEYGQQPGAQGPLLLQRVIQSTDQMSRLLNDLLEYSRLSQAELRLEKVDLAVAADEALALLQEDIRNQGADVAVTIPLPAVTGHPATVTLVITNLVCNALKFVPAGTQPRIRIRATPVAGAVRVEVEDNGIGIEPRDQAKLFQPFQRLHGKTAYPGTGLGLAIVRRAVERMGGRVGLRSVPGQGSCFWADLKAA